MFLVSLTVYWNRQAHDTEIRHLCKQYFIFQIYSWAMELELLTRTGANQLLTQQIYSVPRSSKHFPNHRNKNNELHKLWWCGNHVHTTHAVKQNIRMFNGSGASPVYHREPDHIIRLLECRWSWVSLGSRGNKKNQFPPGQCILLVVFHSPCMS